MLEEKLYPKINPYNQFLLKVSDIHTINIEEYGNLNGKPVIFLHGGPGGGIEPIYARYFDPEKWRIIIFDQRGCGKSTPHAELEENTTWDLVSDIEKIREKLSIEKWVVFGGSWGSTLSLSYSIPVCLKPTQDLKPLINKFFSPRLFKVFTTFFFIKQKSPAFFGTSISLSFE